ncbi:MAG: adenylosuccinate lyase [Flavobacteriales bacterium]|nr:adenylosuccinate lyase [Flavobacteriales bacterium]
MTDALQALRAISPIDGRYRSKTSDLTPYLSEFGLIKYRVEVEIRYLLELAASGINAVAGLNSAENRALLENIYNDFNEDDALWIKEAESETNHDVKAVEYFIKKQLDELGLGGYREFVHFGLTSQDVNNTAIPLSLKKASDAVIIPVLNEVIEKLFNLASSWEQIPMLARTHGQPASPTRLGKEIRVFVVRLHEQLRQFNEIEWPAKFGGATGNFNAHHVAYPEIDWRDFSNGFVSSMGLRRSDPTTQIEHYDNLAAKFDALRRFNVIAIDLCRDIWTYVSMEYFRQKIKANEVGSSAMPHKVNPIDFENAEGNLGIANAVLNHLSEKLPLSRLQRDLTDSTVLRNIGVPLGHMLIAFRSILKGLDKLVLNESALYADLERNWAVVAEAIQTVLRREGYPNPYEKLKELTRTNSEITENSIRSFINDLDVSEEVRSELLLIRPENYTGI